MSNKNLYLPRYELIQSHVINSMSRYWPKQSQALSILPIRVAETSIDAAPLQLYAIDLPEWASFCGVKGKLFVPLEACSGEGDWQSVDWWLAAFLLMECWHERIWELNNTSIHSYSYRLEGWDERVWEHAWVNRIALFMRTWASRLNNQDADQLFGLLPDAEIFLTHDVDAVAKNLPIRIKQCMFNLFNAAKYLNSFEFDKTRQKLKSAIDFLLGQDDWWTFDKLLTQEKQLGIEAYFNFYADSREKTLLRWLFDPSYDIGEQRIQKLMQRIRRQNGVVGLHTSFDTWDSSENIQQQRDYLVKVLGQDVTSCRQHWLRFCWKSTWLAQENAGIKVDTTLMFNNRAGFRSSTALSYHPWNQNTVVEHSLLVQPTVLMDSHFYDYQTLDRVSRKQAMMHWIEETRNVHGQIAVLWHPHTLTKDYGWSKGFQDLINILKETETCQDLL